MYLSISVDFTKTKCTLSTEGFMTITYRGKPSVKIIPITCKKTQFPEGAENELFGIWKDREDTENVEQFVRNIRKGKRL
jgi:antitoxin (DNA-binding transcriptional repressor) of toxin-antitoxin stability system